MEEKKIINPENNIESTVTNNQQETELNSATEKVSLEEETTTEKVLSTENQTQIVEKKEIAEVEIAVEKDTNEQKELTPENETQDFKKEEIPQEETNTEKELTIVETPSQDLKRDKVTIDDYSILNRKELTEKIKELVETKDVQSINDKVKLIKTEYYKKLDLEIKEKKDKIEESEEQKVSYEHIKDENEHNFETILNTYKAKRVKYYEELEKTKKENLKTKYEIIQKIKDLTHSQETFNETFNKFKEYQAQWSETGLVPENEAKQIRDEYNIFVKEFYNYVNINKELKELDLKKNLENKIKLCEKAEELLLEANISIAKKTLQELHSVWKKCGPVPKEKNDEIWERFKTPTLQINTKYFEYLESQNEQQEKNLESKTYLCESVEKYANTEYISHKEWKDASNQVIKIQQLWKGIGYVPKSHNTSIYQRFRTACDKFFERIREFYAQANENYENNLQLKTDLCVRAESLQDSIEWRKTTDIYKRLQNEWKKLGPVSPKISDEIWKRFRKACNTFFDRKKEDFENRKKSEKVNLVKKQELIEEIKTFELSEKVNEDITKLKELQKKWTEIGFVPFENKDEIYKEYRSVINDQFSKLNIDEEKQSELRFLEKVDNLKNMPNAREATDNEIIKIRTRIDEIEGDINVWENNLGFFTDTKNAENMLKDFTDKIKNSKQKVDRLKKQIHLLKK